MILSLVNIPRSNIDTAFEHRARRRSADIDDGFTLTPPYHFSPAGRAAGLPADIYRHHHKRRNSKLIYAQRGVIYYSRGDQRPALSSYHARLVIIITNARYRVAK